MTSWRMWAADGNAFGEPDEDDRAEELTQDAAEERAERRMAGDDGRFSNYSDGWGDAPW